MPIEPAARVISIIWFSTIAGCSPPLWAACSEADGVNDSAIHLSAAGHLRDFICRPGDRSSKIDRFKPNSSRMRQTIPVEISDHHDGGAQNAGGSSLIEPDRSRHRQHRRWIRRRRRQLRGTRHSGGEQPAMLNQMMEITRAASSIGIPGLYVTGSGAVDNAAKHGNLSLRFGLGWARLSPSIRSPEHRC